MRISTFFRFIHVLGVLHTHQIDRLLALGWKRHFLGVAYWLNPCLWFRTDKTLGVGAHVREAFIALGPIFIKLGQVLSTRHDLLPDDIVQELALLQDRVPPFCGKEAEAIVVQALNTPIEQSFSSFQQDCLASASVAQVHVAQLLSGEQVVVKVIRPGIAKKIDRDVRLLRGMADIFMRWGAGAKRFKPHQVIDEFAKHLSLELDLVHEGANAAQLGRHFKQSPLLHVPKVYWSHSRKNVLVMERIRGVKISDVDTMQKLGVDFKVLAENGVTIFFTQLLKHNFFHADMHPGNIFVDCTHPARPRYMAVDFGIMGSLSKQDQRYIAENLLAFFEQDYQRVAEMHVRSGWIAPDTPIEDFAGSIRAVCEPIFQKSFKDIAYAQLLGRLLGVAEQYAMPVQPQLLLLQKTLLNIEGLGRLLYPDLDLWATAKPLLKQWMREQRSPRRFFRQAARQMPYLRDQLMDLPDLLQHNLKVCAQNSSLSERQVQDTACSSQSIVLALGIVLGALGVHYWPWLQQYKAVFSTYDVIGLLVVLIFLHKCRVFSNRRIKRCGI